MDAREGYYAVVMHNGYENRNSSGRMRKSTDSKQGLSAI